LKVVYGDRVKKGRAMETFDAILYADKSWSYIIDENGIKFLMQKGRTFNLGTAGRRKI